MGKKWVRDAQRAFENKTAHPQYFDPAPDLGGDEGRESFRAAIFQAADDQIRDYPPVTAAYDRMISDGISEFDAKSFIANLVARQLQLVLKDQKPFDEVVYQNWLDRLPELPPDE
jgi:hypothetical protein